MTTAENPYFNGLLDGDPSGRAPWYDFNGMSYQPNRGFYAPFADVMYTNIDFLIADSPGSGSMDTTPVNSDAADRFDILYDYKVYFAVRTTEAFNGSEQVYAIRGQADWSFNGSGTLDANGIWTKAPNAGNSSGGNFQNALFTIVTSGVNVPVTTVPWMNDTAATETWPWAVMDQP